MRFQRHEESINPIWVKAWQGHRLPDPGATACGGRVRGHDHRSPSAPRHRARPGCRNVSGGARPAHRLDEFHRLFLDRDARQQSPSPLYRHAQNNSIAEVEKTIYHRTVTSVLTGCLTRGGHPTLALHLEARTALIDSLIESLDRTVEQGADEAWRREIERRLQQIDNGSVELISWDVARKRLHERLDG